jgi:hypothetical protein
LKENKERGKKKRRERMDRDKFRTPRERGRERKMVRWELTNNGDRENYSIFFFD